MRLSYLLSCVPGILARNDAFADPDVTAPIEEDSRLIQPGGVFVARTGGSFDGHTFIASAIERGAVAVIGENMPSEVRVSVPYVQVAAAGPALAYLAASYEGFPARKLTVIGVTGTDGKTTTTHLIYSILKAGGIRAGMISTINAMLGSETLDTGLHVTTPTAPEVQHYLAQMAEAGLTHCVLEATSHGLAQSRVAVVDFDVAVITNIQHEHLDFHGTWERYRDAKAMLFRSLFAGKRKSVPKTAVINLDDAHSAGYLLAIPADRYLRYALQPRPDADVCATSVEYRPDATRLVVRIGDADAIIESALVGAFNVSNILAAIAVAYGLEIPVSAIKAGVESVRGVSGRMERIDEGQNFLAVVDFAHTPNALRVVLKAARLMIPRENRVIVAFGSAGLRDREKRVLMGQVAAELADFTIVTAEDPRTESLDEILAATAKAMSEMGKIEGDTFWRIPDRGRAIFKAVQLARPGDIVLSCGKGHEQSMAFGTTEYPWDDREAMRSALRGTPLLTLPTAAE